MKWKRYKLAEIDVSEIEYTRFLDDDEKIKKYLKMNFDEMPLIIITNKMWNGLYSLLDGFHRMNVCERKGGRENKSV